MEDTRISAMRDESSPYYAGAPLMEPNSRDDPVKRRQALSRSLIRTFPLRQLLAVEPPSRDDFMAMCREPAFGTALLRRREDTKPVLRKQFGTDTAFNIFQSSLYDITQVTTVRISQLRRWSEELPDDLDVASYLDVKWGRYIWERLRSPDTPESELQHLDLFWRYRLSLIEL
jgi:hypothetical protein